MAEAEADPIPEGEPDTGAVEPEAAPDAAPEAPDLPADAFPENWREQLAGENEPLLNQLARFSSPQAFAKGYQDTRTMISDGTYKRPLSENATDEELASWREEQGIPAEPSGYELDLGELVLPEGDEELVDTFKDVALNSNMTPGQVNEAVKWYVELAENEAAQTIESDQVFKDEGVAELRQEWGPEFKGNFNAIKSFLESRAPELGGILGEARDVEGRRLGDNPAVLRELAQLSRELNPAATLPRPDMANQQDVATRKAEIQSFMHDKSKYTAAVQKEYLDILEYEARVAGNPLPPVNYDEDGPPR